MFTISIRFFHTQKNTSVSHFSNFNNSHNFTSFFFSQKLQLKIKSEIFEF